jgi:glutamine---fructose-6-phosphate transaminase (isomerizing)
MDLSKVERSLEGYLRELSQVPQALERLCKFVDVTGDSVFSEAALHIRNSSEVFAFGMASSLWAAWPMVRAFAYTNTRINWLSAYEGLHLPSSRVPRRSLMILVSQSGETIEIKKLADHLKRFPEKPLIVGVTNSPESALSAEADLILEVQAGPEHHAPSKTYVNTLAALLILHSFACAFGREPVRQLVQFMLDVASRIESYNRAGMRWGKEVADLWLEHQGPIQFLAIGAQMASAWQASMLCAETARAFSAVGDWANFRHGFEPQVTASSLIIGFKPFETGPDIWKTTTRSILDRGGKVCMVPNLFDESDLQHNRAALPHPGMISPVWETLPIHYLCMNIAKHRGLDASKIERKVTLEL